MPAENRLPGCHSFRDVARVLTLTRYTVAWRALGVALAAYEAGAGLRQASASSSASPLASFQLVQDKLSRMVARDHRHAAAVPAPLASSRATSA